MFKRIDFVDGEQTPTVMEKRTVEHQQQVTIASRETKGGIHSAESRRANIIRQALSLMPDTLENEGRSNDIAAGMIVTVLGGWFGSRVVKSGLFSTLTYTLLFFLGAALVGILLVAALGNGFIPVELLLIALIAIATIAVLILGVVLTLLIWSSQDETEPWVDGSSPRSEILIPVREMNGQMLVPVKQVNSYPHDIYEPRTKTDALAIHRQTRTEISDETLVK